MKILTSILLATLVAISAVAPAHSQIVEKKSLNLDGAKKAIAAAVDYAKKNNAPGGVIAIVDEGGNLMALERWNIRDGRNHLDRQSTYGSSFQETHAFL